MKKICVLFSLMFVSALGCHAQETISYQAVARSQSGAIIANQAISVKFVIHQGSLNGTSVFTETHTANTNAFGLFTLSIGSVNSSQFQSINWANAPFFLEIAIDPAGGTSYVSVGNQQLMSVPYALYAKTAGNANPTPTITGVGAATVTSSGNTFTVNAPAPVVYTAGTGISISGGVISNTASVVTPTISGSGIVSVSSAGNSFTVGAPAPALNYTATSQALSISQGTAVSTVTLSAGNVDGAGTVGTLPMWASVNTLSNSPVTTYTASGGIVINPSLVGSGAPPQSLQVHGPASGSTYVAHFLQGSNANTGIGISTQPTGGHAIGTLNTQDLGFFTANTNVTGNYPLVLKTSGRLGIGNMSPVYMLDVNGAINSSNFYNLNGLTTAPVTSNSGEGRLYFNSSLNKLMMSENGGAWVPVANTLWTKGTGILYNTSLSDNVGIGTNIPATALDVLGNASVSALRAKNAGTGTGIEGANNSATAAAIVGYNDGAAPSVAGSKSLSASSGNAGRFEVFNAGNTSDALVAVTPGNGATIRAQNTSTNTLASNLSLLTEDGHLKARFNTSITNSDVSTGSNTLGTIVYSTNSNVDQSNDVRGAITMTGSFVMLQNTTKSVITTVSFKKNYKNPPLIVLTPYVPSGFPDNLIVTTQMLNTGLTDFTFWLTLYYAGTGANVNFSSITVNYFVIE